MTDNGQQSEYFWYFYSESNRYLTHLCLINVMFQLLSVLHQDTKVSSLCQWLLIFCTIGGRPVIFFVSAGLELRMITVHRTVFKGLM